MEQTKLDTPIGTAEPETKLQPAVVKVLKIDVEQATFGEKSWDAINITVKHPTKTEPIVLKKVKYEKEGKLKVVGISLSLDKDQKIAKSSALAVLLSYYNASTLKQLESKELQTVLDDKGYLCVKAY